MLALLISAAWAQEPPELNGHVASNLRLGTHDCVLAEFGDCAFLDFRDTVVAGLQVRSGEPGRWATTLDADLRLHGPTAATDLDGASTVLLVQNASLKVHTLSLEVLWGRGEPWQLEVGATRVRWGSADGVRPVDVVNPYDLEQPGRLDQRLATPMAVLRKGIGGVHVVEAVVTPFFLPALLPSQGVDLVGQSGQIGLDQLGADQAEIGTLEDRTDVPGPTLLSVGAGLRWAWFSPTLGDLALSVFHGRDSIPQVGGELRLIGFGGGSDRVDVGVPLTYPKVSQAGLEWRRPVVWDVTAWVELAVVKPSVTTVTFNRAQLDALERLGVLDAVPDPVPRSVSQDGRVYPRVVAGLDRGFGPVYVNLQWLYGFPTERQRADLRHYGLAYVRWNLRPALALDVHAVTDGRGVMAGAELQWLVHDRAELGVGVLHVAAPAGSALAAFEGASHVGTSAALRF